MMVMCAMDSGHIPRPPPPPLGGFFKSQQHQLQHQQLQQLQQPPSTSSGFRLLENHAQDDTASIYSVYKQKIDAMFESDSSSTKNSVQARIEKMFTDVAIDNGIPINEYGCHHFSVDYLGSVPLVEKVSSLSGLQKPLRDLYFAYKKTVRGNKLLTGRLEISASGLKVQYQGEKGDLEQLNSFPTIAVWSAVKFVLQDEPKPSYAFLPLITDPENIDKQQLFRTLDASERKYINPAAHSPLFAVVMRKIGVHKQLECHGFVCQTSEDAIVIAATLYKSLMSHMKAKEKKPKNRGGVTCMSVTSSVFNDEVPVRPPRKKRSSSSSAVSDIDTIDTESAPLLQDPCPKKSTKARRAPRAPDKEDLDAIQTYEETLQPSTSKEPNRMPLGDKWNTYKSNTQKQITAEIKQVIGEGANMGLKRAKSLRRRNEEVKTVENSGDILTKVTIPRSGSFLNAGGLTRLNGQATGGSPLGFNELFNEFRLQEGLHSMDEILGVIIDPEGMSFNDLKPIYKEFLLKLAVTLTKDELYQRSKSIMRRQRKKLLRRNSTHAKKRPVLVCSKLKKLKHIFQKATSSGKDKLQQQSKDEAQTKALPESTISSSSYDTHQFTPKVKQNYRKRRERQSTSEESDFFTLRKNKHQQQQLQQHHHNRNSSSGYVSCSECSFDSDTCTCTSADKCYCSLTQQRSKQQYHCCCQDQDTSLTFCGCDTDSCADSNKCYCPKGTAKPKKHGFTPPIPEPKKILSKKYSNTRSTKSLEYTNNPAEYYERLKSRNSRLMDEGYGGRGAYACSKDARNCDKASRTVHKTKGACTEALAVKKSAEIAALFADIKLSQTTDIAQILPASRYSSSRIVSNALYGSKHPQKKLYSTKNGLYTIQSQSDDSSRGNDRSDYFGKKNKDLRQKVSASMENSLGYLP